MIQLKSISLICLAAVALSACNHTAESSTAHADNGIVGGIEVKADTIEAKSTVSIFDENDQAGCSGILIGEDVILTAGHCVESEAASMKISFGISLSGPGAAPLQGVVAFIRHPDYKKSKTERNDIAVLRFKGPRPSGSVIATLPLATDILKRGTPFWAIGFGRSNGLMNRFFDEDGNPLPDGAGILRKVLRKVEGLRFNEMEFSVNQLDGKGVCFGDSGGPAVIFRADLTPVVVGVASGVFISKPEVDDADLDFDSCTQKGLYMNVRPFISWIQGAIAELDKNPIDQSGQGQGVVEQHPVTTP